MQQNILRILPLSIGDRPGQRPIVNAGFVTSYPAVEQLLNLIHLRWTVRAIARFEQDGCLLERYQQ
jgi:hypothetical protein